ncbi:hypothetical protein I204_05104 [Kwoniella mangroviensis CBS 8886]|nr:hypothetical protein I204_05104 [Kwoniella mangroviensis CBS 8886]
MFSLYAFTLLIFSSFLTLISAKYVDLVSPSEQDLATQLDQYALTHHQEVYHFIAKTYDDRIVIQIRFENDTVGFEGYFTETPQLLEDLELVQKNIYHATVQAGLEGYSNDAVSIDTLKAYRYGTPPEGHQESKGVLCRPCRECLRDVHGLLEKKAYSRCGLQSIRDTNFSGSNITADNNIMSTSSANSKTPLEDQVLPSERPQALSIVEYHTSHPETYIFIARTTSQKVIIQVRHDDPDDKLGIEGYFTETPELIRHIEQAQEDVWKATVDAGLDSIPV